MTGSDGGKGQPRGSDNDGNKLSAMRQTSAQSASLLESTARGEDVD